MKRFLLLIVLLLGIGLYAQVGINTTDPKAMLEIEYKNDLPATMNQTVGLPRVTIEQRNNFENVQAGQMIWNITKRCVDYYDGDFWQCTNGTQLDLAKPTDKCLALVKDKHYGDGEHNFIYCEIEGPDGKRWLNNNLGADYANERSSVFNPKQQAQKPDDYHAYGSLFQFGRDSDGHELVKWTGSEKGIRAKDDIEWKSFDQLSYSEESDPCPTGYHTPTLEDWKKFHKSVTGTDGYVRSSKVWNERKLSLPASGFRDDSSGTSFNKVGSFGSYWSSIKDISDSAWYMYFESSYSSMANNSRAYGFSVRCLKDGQ